MHAQGSPCGCAEAVDVGRAVRAARHRCEMSQEALALDSGLQRKTIYMIERGRSDARLGTLRRIAAAMKVCVLDLIGPRHV